MNNPYQAPKSSIELPKNPTTPKIINWAYVMVGLNWLFEQLDTVIVFFDDVVLVGNFWALGGMSIVNIAIAWWLYQGIKLRHRNAWLLPAFLLLLTVFSWVSEFAQMNGVMLLIYAGKCLTLIVILVILFTSIGKAWRSVDDEDEMLG